MDVALLHINLDGIATDGIDPAVDPKRLAESWYQTEGAEPLTFTANLRIIEK